MHKLLWLSLLFCTPFLTAQISPGGVGTANLSAWFRADDLAAGDVTTWSTQFPNGAGTLTVTDGQTPYPQLEVTPPGSVSNYNRTILFDGNVYTGQNYTTLKGLGNSNITNLLTNVTATDEGSYFCSYFLPVVSSNGHMTLYNSGTTGLQCRNLGASSRLGIGNQPSNSVNAVRNWTEVHEPNIISYKGNRSGLNTIKGYNKNSLLPTPAGASQSSGSDGLYFGYSPTIGTSAYNGYLNEVIFFDRDLTDLEMTKVDTYLAIKYGVTLIYQAGGTSGDYIATDGTIIWDASTSPAYHNDVIGIGRDDIEDLNQKQSHSFDDSVRVYIDALTPANEDNLGTINTDISYLTLGHNDGFMCGTVAGNAEVPNMITSRFEREFKVTNTSFNQDFNIDFTIDTCSSIAGINLANARLLVDLDGDFTDALSFSQADGITISENNGTLTVEGISTTLVPVNDTRYLTIGYIDESFTFSDSSGAICAGEDGWVVFDLGNSVGPIDVEYSDGTTTTTVANIETGDTLFWNPLVTTTYTFTTGQGLINCCGAVTPIVFTQVVNPLPIITLNAFDDTVCVGENITFTANGANTYQWDNGVQNGVPFQVNATTTYEVTATSTEGCVSVLDTTVVAIAAPTITLNPTINEVCDTDINVDLFNYLDPADDNSGTWYDQNGVVIIGGQLDVSQMAGVNTFDYELTSVHCPSVTSPFIVDVKVFKSAGNDMNEHFCNTGTANLNNFLTVNNPGDWTSLDGFPNSVFNPATGIFTMDNLAKDIYTFQYVVTNDSPCDNDTALAFIEISELANIEFNSNFLEGCSPLTVDFTDLTQVNGTTTYAWTVDGNPAGINQNMSYTFDEVRCYDVSLSITTDNFCTSDLTQPNMICINPDPIANFEFEPTTVYSDNPIVNFKNKSSLNAYNSWDFDGLGGSSQPNPTFTFPLGKEGDYEVQLIVTSDKGCIDSITKVVPIRDQTLFYVPNAFTPDGDNVNNVFKPEMTVGVDPQNYKLEIFNRWGQVIFESNNYDVGWDGTYGGKIVKTGTYVWKIRFNELKTEEDIITHGTVILLR